MSSDVDVTQQNMQRLSGSYSFSKISFIFLVLVLFGIYRISSYKLDIFPFKVSRLSLFMKACTSFQMVVILTDNICTVSFF